MSFHVRSRTLPLGALDESSAYCVFRSSLSFICAACQTFGRVLVCATSHLDCAAAGSVRVRTVGTRRRRNTGEDSDVPGRAGRRRPGRDGGGERRVGRRTDVPGEVWWYQTAFGRTLKCRFDGERLSIEQEQNVPFGSRARTRLEGRTASG
jgi:hypothetical protein